MHCCVLLSQTFGGGQFCGLRLRDATTAARRADFAHLAGLVGIVGDAVAVVVDAVALLFGARKDVRVVVVAIEIDELAGLGREATAEGKAIAVAVADLAVVDEAVAVVVAAVADVFLFAPDAAGTVAIHAGRARERIRAGAGERRDFIAHDRLAAAAREHDEENEDEESDPREAASAFDVVRARHRLACGRKRSPMGDFLASTRGRRK